MSSAVVTVEDSRVGNWLETYSAVKFWPADPRPEEVRIQDIAWSLSRQCRFGGHVREFYSVAQHCILVAENLPAEDKLWGLLHDASETYVVDVPSPVKAMLQPRYGEIEGKVQQAIATRFGLPWPMPSNIHIADRRALLTERRDLRGSTCDLWVEDKLADPLPPFAGFITPMSPDEARAAYLNMFSTLVLKRLGYWIGAPDGGFVR